MSGMGIRVPLYAAVLAAAGAFSTFFVAGALALFLGAAVAAIIIGSLERFRFLLMFPAIVLYVLLAVYREIPFSREGWRELGLRVGEDVYLASGTMYSQPLPYEATPGLFVILLPIVFVVGVFATSATLYEESPVISVAVLGLTIGVLSTLNFETGTGLYFAVFLVAGVVLLLRTGNPESDGRGAFAAALVVVGVLLVPQIAQAAIRPPLVDWTKWGTGGGGAQLSAQADVGNYLSGSEETPLFRVRSEEPLHWRGGTLDYFNGVRWLSTARHSEERGSEISYGVERRQVEQRFEVLNARTDLVFGGYQITYTDLGSVDRKFDGSWVARSQLEEGTTYRVVSEVPQPTERQLRRSGAEYPAEVRERYLQLPGNVPGVVGETAEEIELIYSPNTPYDRVRAIERYLRYDGGFTYNIDVDFGRADRAMEEFLGEGRTGFCTQFATAMALIARDMGVPTRVVYGATTGERVAQNEYVVRGQNMHTWVEVYFPRVGWYPFDPTPGFAMPQTMEANAPGVEPDGYQSYGVNEIIPENPALRRDGSEAESLPITPNGSDDPGGGGPAAEGLRVPVWAFYALAAGLLMAAVPFTKRTLAAANTPRALYRDVLLRLRDLPGARLPAAGVDSLALTPTERLMLAVRSVGLDPEPFERFARAYSEHLYAPEPGANVRRAHRQALRELRRLPTWRRALAAVNPASLVWLARLELGAARARWRAGLRRAVRNAAGGLR
jgi:transglutaminase-like putative cysteine protease